MKKMIFSFACVLFTVFAMAQKPAYFEAMGKALARFGSVGDKVGFQQVANQFGMIAKAEPAEWLPVYYQAQCYVLMSFMTTDAAEKDQLLDVAEPMVNRLLELAPNESEVYSMQAFYYSGRLVVNPVERGQKFGALSNQAIGKALVLEPNNPRARMMQLQMQVGSAPFMGLDPKSYCPQIRELQARWDDYQPKSPIYPSWGKAQVETMAKACE